MQLRCVCRLLHASVSGVALTVVVCVLYALVRGVVRGDDCVCIACGVLLMLYHAYACAALRLRSLW